MSVKEAEPGPGAGVSKLISPLPSRGCGSAGTAAPGLGQPVAPGGSSTPGMVPCQLSVCLLLRARKEQGLAEALPSPHGFLPIPASPRQGQTPQPLPWGHVEEPRTKRALLPQCYAHPTGLSSQAGREGIKSQGSKLNSITKGLTETGSTALANIFKAPCNSSFVCFSLKKQLEHFKSQLRLYSSANNCLVPTQSSADRLIPAAIQAPACSRCPAVRKGGMCRPGLPLLLPWPLPAHRAPTSTPSQEEAATASRKRRLHIPSHQAREVLSKLVFMQTLSSHYAQGEFTFNSHQHGESLTATVFSERQSL